MKKYYRLVLTLLVFIFVGWSTLRFILPGSRVGRSKLDGVLSGPIGKLFGTGSGGRDNGHQISSSVVTLPPLYPTFFEYEASLPQNRPSPNDSTSSKTKYIHFANHVHLLGFNNHLQEVVLNAQLAHLTNRSFVVYEYVWSPAWAEGKPWSVWPEGSGEVEVVETFTDPAGQETIRGRIVNGDGRGRIIPSRIPSSVLLGGWVAGGVRVNTTTSLIDNDGASAAGDHADLTPISRPHFEDLCPSEERFYINAADVNDALLSEYVPLGADDPRRESKVRDSNAEDHMRAWIARLEREDVKDQRCVEVMKNSGQSFDFMVFGDDALNTLWPSLRLSPILKFWSWSTLVHGAFIRNALDLELSWPQSRVPSKNASPRSGQELRDDGKDSHGIEERVVQRRQAKQGVGMFGERVKHAVARELQLTAMSWDGVKQLDYPTYPNGYPHPPSAVNSENRTTDIRSAKDTIDPILLGQPVTVLPYPKSPSAFPSSVLSSSTTGSKPETANGTLPILALHLRRGDFAEHCTNLADWGSAFGGYSSLGAKKVPYVGGRRSARGETGDSVDGFVVPQVVERERDDNNSDDDDDADDLADFEIGTGEGIDMLEDDPVEERQAQVSIVAVKGTPNRPSLDFNTSVAFDGVSSSPPTVGETPFVVSSQDERRSIYLHRCFPSAKEIGRRVEEVVKDWAVWRFIEFVTEFEKTSAVRRANGEDPADEVPRYASAVMLFQKALETRLASVYIMTNGDENWAAEVGREVGRVLRELAIKATVEVDVEGPPVKGTSRSTVRQTRFFSWSNSNWKKGVLLGRDGSAVWIVGSDGDEEARVVDESVLTISSSRNLRLTHEEKHVSQAVDMYIAQRAEMFIGNGFSSLTGNVVMLRMKDGLEGVQTRLW